MSPVYFVIDPHPQFTLIVPKCNNRCDRTVALNKIELTNQQCKQYISDISRSRKKRIKTVTIQTDIDDEYKDIEIDHNHNHNYSNSHVESIRTLKVKTFPASFDVTYPNKRYAHSSRNGTSTLIADTIKKVIHFSTRSKGYNYDPAQPTSGMDKDLFSKTLDELQTLNLYPTHMSVDGQKQIPCAKESRNA